MKKRKEQANSYQKEQQNTFKAKSMKSEIR